MGIEVAWLLEKAWVLLFAIIWYSKKKREKDDDKRDKLLTELTIFKASVRSEFVSEAQMKLHTKEAIEPLKESQQEIKILLQGLNTNIISLSKEVAVQHAVGNLSNENK